MELLYQAKHYRDFVAAQLEKRGRGARTWLAETMGVQASFLWSVLSGKQDFTPEQLLTFAEVFQLNAFETEALLIMLNRDRAASVRVKGYYQKQLDRLLSSKSDAEKRVRATAELGNEYLVEYCSDWLNLAVTLAVHNKKLRTSKSLAERFQVELSRMNEVLALIEKTGLVQFDGTEYVPTQNRFHIGKNQAALKLHHHNWRQKALLAIDQRADDQEIHYSSLMSIDASTFDQIRNLLLRSIERMEPGIKKAKNEELVVFALDLFRI
jgi:uncharacterized protein (TIGR02147 family)